MRDKTKKYFEDLLSNTNGEYELVSPYISCIKKVNIKHTLCNNVFEMKPNDFLEGHRCPECAKKLRVKKSKYDIEKYKAEIKEKYGDEYTILSNSLTKLSDTISIRHNLCGYEYNALARNLLKRGMGCRKCALERTTKIMLAAPRKAGPEKTTKEFIDEFNRTYQKASEYEVLGEYKGSKIPIELKHKVCGSVFYPIPNNLLTHQTECPQCMKGRTFSKEEKEVLDFIKTFYSDQIDENIILRNEDNKSYSIDIYLPKLKLGIEYNGLYYHSDKKLSKSYHLDKLNFVNNLGNRLITIFEDEWNYKKDIVKDRLKNIIGCNDDKIYARKCSVGEITYKEKNDFLDNYHLQGHDTSNLYFGLKYNNDLVAVMTFSKLRKALGNKSSNDSTLELSRFASKLNVVGGFSKLLKYAIKKFSNNITTIRTYADLRWSDRNNNLYQKNGFILKSIAKPGYFYCLGDKRYFRYNFRKQVLKDKFPEVYDSKLTEFEIMDKTRYFRVWDCGNLVYEYYIKK